MRLACSRCSVFVGFLTLSCGGLKQEQKISECGGFSSNSSSHTLTARDAGDAPAYCDAEVLEWHYEAGVLTLANKRILLNCCGEHSITIEKEKEGEYLVRETDEPEGIVMGGARCSCMCVFDFQVETPDVPERTITLKVVRDITDDDQPERVVWNGQINLEDGFGRIVVDETVLEGWCEEPAS